MNIKALHDLIHQLTPNEHTLIRYALKSSRESDENKLLRLFEFLIAQNKNISRSATSMAMYKVPPDTRINKLINRLWKKVLDIIASENFLEKSGRLGERSRLRIGVRKKMLQYTILGFLHGGFVGKNTLIEEAIRDAEKSEYHIMLIELYGIKKQLAIFDSNAKEYSFYAQQIIYYKKCYSIQEKLAHHYNELTKNDAYGNSDSPQKRIKYVKSALDKLKKEKKYMISVYSKYIFSMMEFEYKILKQDFLNAKALLKQLLQDLGSSPLMRGSSHIAARVESELCTCELFLSNYSQAIKHAEKTLVLFSGKGRLNHYINLELLFRPVFYTRDFDRAEKIIADFLLYQDPFLNDFRVAKPRYFQACIHFKKGEFTQALKIVNKPMPLNKDKTGYDIAVRILRIQCLLALERFDEGSSQIENLRKHISRNNKKAYTSGRNMLITRVLVLMQKRGFAGKQNKTESELIKKLSLASGQYKWTPITSELIRFHEWYAESKLI